MRIYPTMAEAVNEIKRDVAKGSHLNFTRVQNQVDLSLGGRECLMYSYGILNGFPSLDELMMMGRLEGFKLFVEKPDEMKEWLETEKQIRLNPSWALRTRIVNEKNHPALKSTLEGQHPSYTYQELLVGMREQVVAHLAFSPDSRRAYWPIFREVHAIRAPFATRVPCSLGYEFMVREIPGKGPHLSIFYLQRSADFDTFLLSDIWLARQVQEQIAADLRIPAGPLYHNIISLHSFDVSSEEIY